MDGVGTMLNSISRIKELNELKTEQHQQAYLDCYKYRLDKGYCTNSHPGLGSKESAFYKLLIDEGYTVAEIGKITDYLGKVLGTSTAIPKGLFWNAVHKFATSKEAGPALKYLKHEYDQKNSALKKFGVIIR